MGVSDSMWLQGREKGGGDRAGKSVEAFCYCSWKSQKGSWLQSRGVTSHAQKGRLAAARVMVWQTFLSPELRPPLNSYMTSCFDNLRGHLITLRHVFLSASIMSLSSVLGCKTPRVEKCLRIISLGDWRKILTMSVSIHLLLGTVTVHMKRNLTSWKFLEAICKEALEL